MTELVFRSPRSSDPTELVFGESYDPGPGSDVVVRVAVRLPGPRVALQLRRRVTAKVRVQLPGPRVVIQAVYESRTDRPMVCVTSQRFEEGAARAAQHSCVYEQAAAVGQVLQQGGGDAQARATGVDVTWQEAQRLAASAQQLMESAQGIGRSLSSNWQEAVRRRQLVRQAWQEAGQIGRALLSSLQETYRRRAAVSQEFGVGSGAGASVQTDLTDARPVGVVHLGRYEEAWQPRPGFRPPVIPPVEPPCYDPPPGGAVELVFAQAWTNSAELVFFCCKGGTDPEPPRYVIPVLKVYMTAHTMEAALLPSMEPVVLRDVVIASDDDGFGWSFSANGPEHLLDQLAPSGGLPARVRVVVDGIDFVFAVQSLSRSRRFGEHSVSVQGASVTALLGSPMPESTWLSTQPATAQQLIVNALEFTGVSIDWRVTDWLVSAGAWSHRGTPLSAVMRVAESIGAVVRSHRTQEQLIIAPRYPVLPWNWAAATPDVRMPADVIVTDELSPEPRANYNAVYVVGQVGGIQGHVRRTGSAGDVLAPDITDALITDVVAARQRGEAVLGAAGGKLMQSITMPLITGGTAPGLILPGQLLEVDDTKETWRGLVRASRLTASMPVVRQQITVEREAS